MTRFVVCPVRDGYKIQDSVDLKWSATIQDRKDAIKACDRLNFKADSGETLTLEEWSYGD